MRQFRATAPEQAISILTLDDDPIMTSTLQAFFRKSGYNVDMENDPLAAIERVRGGSYDILLLDFLMSPICGDQVVERIREFDTDLNIIMLTGHKDMAPPMETLRTLEIQGYYEKSERFDQLALLVEAAVKSVRQLRTIRGYRNGLATILDSMPEYYRTADLGKIAEMALLTADDVFSVAAAAAAVRKASGEWLIRTSNCTVTEKDAEDFLALLRDNGPVFSEKEAVYPIGLSENACGFLRMQALTRFNPEARQLISVFARQLASAADSVLLGDILREKNAELDAAYRDLGSSYTDMIATVRRLVDAKDIYTRNHSDRVSFYAVELARRLGRDERYLERLGIAGLFHDIGKIGVPDSILLKADRLTDEEYDVIRSHSERGARILSGLSAFSDVVPWVRAHHEGYDGRGYPDHLAGEDIPEQARIIAVADSFDAMTSDRRYRAARSLDAALDEIARCRGTQFDPVFADAFIGMMRLSDVFERAKSSDIEQGAEVLI